MGKRGPSPRPTNLKLLHGESRPSRVNANEPTPVSASPECPPEVSPAVREVWDHAVDHLERMDLAAACDRDALLCYCEAVVTHRRASALLASSDVLVRGVSGKPVRNPALQVQRDAAYQIRQFAQEFGFTPSARTSIEVPSRHDSTGAERLLS